MEAELDYSVAKRNPFAAKLRKDGFRITVRDQQGVGRTEYFPPGTVPSLAPSVHVYATSDGWAVRSSQSTRAYRTAKTQSEAVAIGIEFATRSRSELIVHPAST